MLYYGPRNYYEHDDTPPDYCVHGINRQFAECGACWQADRDAAEQDFWLDTDPQQTRDEQMGAALAARFGTERDR